MPVFRVHFDIADGQGRLKQSRDVEAATPAIAMAAVEQSAGDTLLTIRKAKRVRAVAGQTEAGK